MGEKNVEDLYCIISKLARRGLIHVRCEVKVAQTSNISHHGPVDMLILHGPKAKQSGTKIFNPESELTGRTTDNPQSNLNGYRDKLCRHRKQYKIRNCHHRQGCGDGV